MIESTVETRTASPESTQSPVLNRERWKFTVDDYYAMAAAGVFTADDRVELIEGEIFKKSPISSVHAEIVTTLMELLMTSTGRAALVRVQHPIRLSAMTEPEPDLALVRRHSYRGTHPTPDDTYLIIEVSDSMLQYDRDVMSHLYAASGVPKTWVVDVVGEAVIRFTDPTAYGYQYQRRFERGEQVESDAVPSVHTIISITDLFVW